MVPSWCRCPASYNKRCIAVASILVALLVALLRLTSVVVSNTSPQTLLGHIVQKTQDTLSAFHQAQDTLEVFDFRTGVQELPSFTPINVTESLAPRHELVAIDRVHLQALVHCSSSLLVVDRDNRMLTLKRAAHVRSCPNTWALLGEHRSGREENIQTATRGIREELGKEAEKHIRFIKPLMRLPLFLRYVFGPSSHGRADLQVTYFWWVQLDQPADALALEFDREVAHYGWSMADELENWTRDAHQNLNSTSNMGDEMCHRVGLLSIEAALTAFRQQSKTGRQRLMNTTNQN